jgi:hypothetical protein
VLLAVQPASIIGPPISISGPLILFFMRAASRAGRLR